MVNKISILILIIVASVASLFLYSYFQPRIISFGPNEQINNTDESIQITYRTEVVPESVICNLIITPNVDFTWAYENRVVTIKPNDGWKRNQTYHIRLRPGVKSLLGFSSKMALEWSFNVLQADEITLSLLGDILLDELPTTFHAANPSYAFEMLNDELLLEKNFVIGNLECPISDRGSEVTEKKYRFRAGREAIDILQAGNIDMVTLSNNHALDYGPQALLDTVVLCQEANIVPVGYGEQGADSVRPTIVEFEGYRIGVVSYLDKLIIPYALRDLWQGVNGQAGVKYLDDTIIDEVKTLSKEVDIVIVSLHWGVERSHQVTDNQRQLAEELIDSGADVIMGHHPHVPQAVERYHDGVIIYSLGNFIFPPTDEHLRDTFAATVIFNRDGLKDIKLYPLRPVNGRPHSMNIEEATIFLKRLQQWSSAYATTLTLHSNYATID